MGKWWKKAEIAILLLLLNYSTDKHLFGQTSWRCLLSNANSACANGASDGSRHGDLATAGKSLLLLIAFTSQVFRKKSVIVCTGYYNL